jgi:glycosyltransferase involved in cell wall biosynthesis
MRILWASDSPAWPTGLGNITRALCTGLAGFGHEVFIIGGGREHSRPRRHRHFTVFPGDGRNPSPGTLTRCLRHLQPDVLVTVVMHGDLGAATTRVINRYRHSSGGIWVLYCPVHADGEDGRLPPKVARILGEVDVPVVMSRQVRMLARVHGIVAPFLPVGVDTSLFRPDVKQIAKRALGYDKRFVVLCDARNQLRKLLPRTLEIFRRFAAGKNDVLLHLHCDPFDPASKSGEYSYNIAADVEFLGLADKVRFTRGMSIGRGLSLPLLAALYRGADVHLLTSFSEGFGIPTLQAAAAGVVPLAPDWGVNRELIKGHGGLIRVCRFVREQGFKCYALADIDDAVDKLDRLYGNRARLDSQGRAARRFAQSYDWTSVVSHWHDLLEREVPRVRRARARRRALPEQPAFSRRRPLAERRSAAARFTIPVTLPPTDPALARVRITGLVYLSGPADVAVFKRLLRIFPRLSAWSPRAPYGVPKRRRVFSGRAVASGSVRFRRYLAASTLAIDVGGSGPGLPSLAAELGVPLVGSSRTPSQRALWPGLTVETSDVAVAAAKARQVLTDHDLAASVCALARRRHRRNDDPTLG